MALQAACAGGCPRGTPVAPETFGRLPLWRVDYDKSCGGQTRPEASRPVPCRSARHRRPLRLDCEVRPV